MVNCDYCKKEIDRKMFCSASHKVMYHRKHKVEGIMKDGTPKKLEVIVEKEDVATKEWFPQPKMGKISGASTKTVVIGDKVIQSSNRFELCKKHKVFKSSCGCE